MTKKELLKYFPAPEWEHSKFLTDECLVQNKREPDVYDGSNTYLCILWNNNWQQGDIRLLVPYIYLFEDRTLLGWTDHNGTTFNHFEHNVDDCYNSKMTPLVIAWRKLQ